MGFFPQGVEDGGAELDLNTVELFARFFTIPEMVTSLGFLHINPRELTLLKAALLQELSRQVALQGAMRAAVREAVINALPRPSAE
jgi:hypothetical protein